MMFQILFTCFAVIAVLSSIFTGKNNGMSLRGIVLWVLLWCVAVGMVLVPASTDYIAAQFGIGRGVDVVLYSTIPVLFFLLFRLHVKIARLESDITKVVRAAALDQVTKQPK